MYFLCEWQVITLTEELLATANPSESTQNDAGLSLPNYSAGVRSEVVLFHI